MILVVEKLNKLGKWVYLPIIICYVYSVIILFSKIYEEEERWYAVSKLSS